MEKCAFIPKQASTIGPKIKY